jgi:diketogulonate reductase-like aldo/keto reductase
MSIEMPKIGLGTFQATDPTELEKAITYAIEDAGYRHIDTAHYYSNEEFIGNALQKVFAKGKVKREDLFITTKLTNFNHRPERVEPALRASLKKLQLSYVDLYLVHWPHAHVPSDDPDKPLLVDDKTVKENIDIITTWKAMEDVYKKGLTKKIGVSNFSIEMLERMEYSDDVTIQPYTNQVEHNLYLQQGTLIKYLEGRNILLTSYSPIGNNRVGPFGVKLFEDPALVEIAKEVKKTPAQVALKFLLDLSPIVRIIPKSVTPSRIKENIELDFELSAEQIKKLKARNKMHRGVDPFIFDHIDSLSLGH